MPQPQGICVTFIFQALLVGKFRIVTFFPPPPAENSSTIINACFCTQFRLTDIDHRVAEGPHGAKTAGVQHVWLHLKHPKLVRTSVKLLLDIMIMMP